MSCCCIPTITATGVTVNTSTNIATITLATTLPSSGRFRLRFPNIGAITPAQTPQATIQMSAGTTSYTAVYNCPCCGATPGVAKLSSIVQKAASCCNHILNGTVGSDGSTVFLTDCLPAACVSYSTTNTAAG